VEAIMARAIWTGVISFGLVSVPVGLYSATEEHEVSFHQFQKDTSDRIRYKRVNERTGKEVEYSHIVKGADVGGGKYVMLGQDELDSVAPGRSRSLEIQAFVDLDEIDPIYFQKTYYLGPSGEQAKKTYALLRDAMADMNRAGIATFVMRGKEYLAAIRADRDLLLLETMFFADEVRDPKSELENLPGKTSFSGKELTMASQLIESMSDTWRPADFRDTYTERVNDLIESKRKGREFTAADDAPDPTNVVDLMAALQASVDAARTRRGSSPRKGKSAKTTKTAGRSTARKTPAKRSAKKATAKSTAKKVPARKTAAKSTAKKASSRKAS
jgi:DNA end-binding protein Ku